jgi:arginyl-tRNA synthetase
MEVVDILRDKGLTYEKDGATWYKATEFGSEKDEVLIRANGNPTYFAADIAYHRNKFSTRHFDTCIDVWGADHHGHVARMKGAMDAVGLDGSKLKVVLMQLVKLLDNGVPVKMSKRTGKAIQLADLLDEVPVDAARFFFNLREATSQMDFDLGLAVQQNSQNPVYYVQYAHARICSILRQEEAKKYNFSEVTAEALDRLSEPAEVELIRYLSSLPNEIIAAAKEYEPARMTRYVLELATKYHKFYHDCRVLGDDKELSGARLLLCDCVRQVIANILNMLKVTAPERMAAQNEE